MKQSVITKWIMAVRPRTLPASACPVIAAGAYGWYFGSFNLPIFIICLIFALLAQSAANLANDYFDFKSGADNDDRVGPRRMVASGDIAPQQVLMATIGVLTVACAIGCILIYLRGWELLPIGIIIALFAVAYSAGPYPLAYHGLGDIAVVLFFGFAALGLTYYVMAGDVNGYVWLGCLAFGGLIENILLVNNYRDADNDAQVGKRTTVVMFGRRWVIPLYFTHGVIAIACVAAIDWWLIVFFVPYLLLHISTTRKMTRRSGAELNPVLGETARNLLLFTLTLVAGLAVLK
ncbi:MAG: 1,4-dihydroxy-2-naphthoate octaprenyltransferase [Alistipes sp.]